MLPEGVFIDACVKNVAQASEHKGKDKKKYKGGIGAGEEGRVILSRRRNTSVLTYKAMPTRPL